MVSIMKKKKSADIRKLMDVSENIAVMNEKRYKDFKKTYEPDHAKQALLTFNGEVYTKIEVESFSDEDFEFAQNHVRILSGLYGLLKPMDLIQPYRLEMGIKLKNKKGKNLYEFWGKRIAKAITSIAGDAPVVNLASAEYFKAIDQKSIKAPIVSPVFLEFKKGKYQNIGIFSKQARGMMTNFIIKNRITDPQVLKTFNEAGYEWAGNDTEWKFVR